MYVATNSLPSQRKKAKAAEPGPEPLLGQADLSVAGPRRGPGLRTQGITVTGILYPTAAVDMALWTMSAAGQPVSVTWAVDEAPD